MDDFNTWDPGARLYFETLMMARTLNNKPSNNSGEFNYILQIFIFFTRYFRGSQYISDLELLRLTTSKVQGLRG